MNHIVNVGEVPALLAVSKNRSLLSGQHPAAENSQHSRIMRCRVLVGSKDIEVAQHHRLQPIHPREASHVMFASQLGYGIRRNRVGQHRLLLGQRGRVAISRRRPCIHHPSHPGLARSHQHVQRGRDAVQVGAHRIGHRTRDRGQRGLVKYEFDARAGPGADGWIGQVTLNKLHRLKPYEVSPLPGYEVIDAAHSFAARQ